jgi:hypothetical protein
MIVAKLFSLRFIRFYKMDYSENTADSQEINTWLSIKFTDDISDSLGSVVPYPHKHYVNGVWVYSWLIDGFFGTKKSMDYLNDIIARFIITFPNSSYYKHYNDIQSTITPIKLRQFQNLKSRATQIVNSNYRYDGTRDLVFWCLKLHSELLIQEKGIFSYDELYSYGTDNFIEQVKDRSTLKAKCRNIFRWYLDRDFKIPNRREKSTKTKEQIMATRQEHAKKIHTKLAADTKRKVLNVITGMFKDEYRKKNGDWNISKIAKDSGTSRNTVMKYLPKETLF